VSASGDEPGGSGEEVGGSGDGIGGFGEQVDRSLGEDIAIEALENLHLFHYQKSQKNQKLSPLHIFARRTAGRLRSGLSAYGSKASAPSACCPPPPTLRAGPDHTPPQIILNQTIPDPPRLSRRGTKLGEPLSLKAGKWVCSERNRGGRVAPTEPLEFGHLI